MSRFHRCNGRRALGLAFLATAVAATFGVASPADAAIRKDCGGRATTLVDRSSKIALVVRERGADDDLYGGDHRYFACYGKHGKSRILMDLRSPNYPRVGLTALWNRHVAMELTVDDATCGKYTPDECPTLRTISAWDAKTGRLQTQGHAEGPLDDLAVSPRGALAWVEPAIAPKTGSRVRAGFGEGGTTTLTTTNASVTQLAIGLTKVRWLENGELRSASVPARSVVR